MRAARVHTQANRQAMNPLPATSTRHGDNLTLIGMPGAGKSTVGVLLAKRIGYAFVDTDLLIQTGEDRYLQQIIQKQGMEGFCDLEAGYIMNLKIRRTVVATGGSVIYRPHAMAHLQSLGHLIFLDIELETLRQRLGDLDARGVVVAPGQTIESLYAERHPLYCQYGQLRLGCTGCTPEQMVNRIIAVLPQNLLRSHLE